MALRMQILLFSCFTAFYHMHYIINILFLHHFSKSSRNLMDSIIRWYFYIIVQISNRICILGRSLFSKFIFFSFPRWKSFSKKIIKNIPYGERVQLGNFFRNIPCPMYFQWEILPNFTLLHSIFYKC